MPKISTEWKQQTLGEIAEIVGGGTPTRSRPEFFSGDIPWATPTDVTALDGYLLYDTKEYITQEAVDNSSTRLLPVGTVLLTSRATIGSVAIAMRPMCTNQGFANFICAPEVHNRYLAWFLRSSASYLKGLGGTTTFPEISKSTLRNITIRYPVDPLKQEQIADLLDDVDSACRVCDQINREMEKLITVLFVKIFGDPLSNPKKWNVVELGQYAEIAGGLQITPKRNSSRGIPYLRVANVYRDRLVLSEIKTMDVSPAELKSKALQRGDILVVEGHGNPEELGRAAVWTGAIDPCVHQNHLIRIRTNGNILRPEYLSRLINSSYGRNYFLKVGKTTSGLNTISTTVVKSFPTLLAPPELQEYFTNLIHEYEEYRDVQVEIAKELKYLFSSLLSHIFTGISIDISLDEATNKPSPSHISTKRTIWSKLSITQRTLWEASQIFTEPFKVEDLGERVHSVYGTSPNREYLWSSLDLLDALGVTLKEGNNNLDRWRRPDPENDPEINI